ncbi:MAG: hypothetical protein ACMUEM_06485 [Flavobacteriales bacterium AspAUS03]
MAICLVDIEQNAKGNPPYVFPAGVMREEFLNTAISDLQNESSMSLTIRNLCGANSINVKKDWAVFCDYPNGDFGCTKRFAYMRMLKTSMTLAAIRLISMTEYSFE